MFAFLMTLFVILSVVLAFLILLQQGKGDMGLGSMSGSRQMLFGGSGGQSFFEKATWIIGGIFVLGALGLSILKSKSVRQSRLEGFTKTHAAQTTSNRLETKTTTEDSQDEQTQPDEDSTEDNS
jgi:protein translocase SecG subunit